MPVSATRRMMAGGWGSPKIDIKSPSLYAPFWRDDMVAKGGTIVNGTGICTGSPLYLAVGANTVTVTQAGNFTVTMPEGGTVASGTMTVTASPVTIPAGIPTTVTTTGAIGNITCTVSNIIRSKDRNNRALTITGPTKGIQGRTFDQTDDKIRPPQNQFDTLTNGTIIGWAQTTSLATYGVVFAHEVDDNNRLNIYHANSVWKYLWLVGGVGANDVSTGVSTSTSFIYYVVTFGAAGLCVYINNAIILSDPTITTTFNDMGASNPTLRGDTIGDRLPSATGPFGGVVGEITLDSRAYPFVETQKYCQLTKWRYQ